MIVPRSISDYSVIVRPPSPSFETVRVEDNATPPPVPVDTEYGAFLWGYLVLGALILLQVWFARGSYYQLLRRIGFILQYCFQNYFMCVRVRADWSPNSQHVQVEIEMQNMAPLQSESEDEPPREQAIVIEGDQFLDCLE